MKKEETLEMSTSNHGNDLINTPEVINIIEEEADDKDLLCKTPEHCRVQQELNNTLTDYPTNY